MTRTPPATPWLAYPKPNPQASIRLFCFPYAGGGATGFRAWEAGLPNVELCLAKLPGRESRLTEPPYTSMSALVEALAQALPAHTEKPYAFFGHSMGAIIAFELARACRRRGLPLPRALFVSGRRAPQLPERDPITYNLPEPELIAELRRLGGTPQEVLEHPELMRLMLPLLRADFEVIETYRYEPEPPLDCSLTAFGGLEDAEVTPPELDAWGAQTTRAFTRRLLPGDHFFLHTARPTLLAALAQDLNRLAQAARGPATGQ